MAYKVDKKGKKIKFIFPIPKALSGIVKETTAPSTYFGTLANDGCLFGEVTITFAQLRNKKNEEVLKDKLFPKINPSGKETKMTKAIEKMLNADLDHIKKNVDLK